MLLLGKPVADNINEETAKTVNFLKTKNIHPCICVIRMGQKEDDLSYERTVFNKAKKLGIEARSIVLSADASQFEVENTVRYANMDKDINGILIFRPLSKHINEKKICSMISPEKDIDGISPISSAHVFGASEEGFYPCTAEACIRMLDNYNIDLDGKKVTVLGRSLVIGKPAAILLLSKNATVTICHSHTENLKDICKNSDIIISSIGKANFIDKNYLSENMTILDVGINVTPEGNITGDVNTEDALKLNCNISPVPRGIGSITSSLVLWHTALAGYKMLS